MPIDEDEMQVRLDGSTVLTCLGTSIHNSILLGVRKLVRHDIAGIKT